MIISIPSYMTLLSDPVSLSKEALEHAKTTHRYTERLFDHPTAEKISLPINDIRQDKRKELIEGLNHSHHTALVQAVERELAQIGSALIIDCRSIATPADLYEQKERKPQADICIGSDPYHTPLALVFSAVKHFRARGYSVKVNEPVSGSYVPMRYSQTNKHVCSMRIAIDADLYKDSLEPLKSDINSWLTGYLDKS